MCGMKQKNKQNWDKYEENGNYGADITIERYFASVELVDPKTVINIVVIFYMFAVWV